MNKNLVSIIMPTYKCRQYIVDSIQSVQRQTYRDWELIIVDDCSQDGTIEVVNEIQQNDNRIRLLRNSVNCGAALSRNTALREAKGRWIAFLDSDDLWEPEKLEKQVRFMEEHGYTFSYTRYQEIDMESNPTGVCVSGPKRIARLGMYAFCWPGCLTVMYDALKVGLVQIADIKKNNDYAMWLEICRTADCYMLPEVLAKYRRGRSGSVSSHGVMVMARWHYRLWREGEGMCVVRSAWWTAVNMVFGLYKKLRYVQVVL